MYIIPAIDQIFSGNCCPLKTRICTTTKCGSMQMLSVCRRPATSRRLCNSQTHSYNELYGWNSIESEHKWTPCALRSDDDDVDDDHMVIVGRSFGPVFYASIIYHDFFGAPHKHSILGGVLQ